MQNWRDSGTKYEDVVVSSRIRLARNLKHHRFPALEEEEEAQEVEKKVAKAVENLPESYYHESLRNISSEDAKVHMEHHLISPELIKQRDISAYFLREDQKVNLLVNEEDHLRIQVLSGGLDLFESYRIACDVEERLAEHLDFAFHPQYGYLTACPTNVGTGMRASAMVFLPGIVAGKQLKSWIDSLAKLGVIVRGMYGEGSQALADMYQISNQRTLGFEEEAMIAKLASMLQNLIEEEREYREHLLYYKGLLWFEDKIYRSLGALSHARTISMQEALEHLANLRLGAALDIYKDKSIRELDKMMFHIQKHSMEQYGKTLKENRTENVIRGMYLRHIFSEVN